MKLSICNLVLVLALFLTTCSNKRGHYTRYKGDWRGGGNVFMQQHGGRVVQFSFTAHYA